MIFKIRPFGPIATNSILLASSTTKRAYIFDAPQGSFLYWKQYAQEFSLSIEGLLLTHSHWDHIADAALIKEFFGVPVWIHTEDAGNLKVPGSDGLPLYFAIGGIEPDQLLFDGEKIDLGGMSFLVLHTPGHTPGGVCFYSAEKKLLISGDTLFEGSIGRLDLPTARPEMMKASLEKLALLPAETQVFPGHGDPTTIGDEMAMINYLCEEEL